MATIMEREITINPNTAPLFFFNRLHAEAWNEMD
jgi:hypothetical protein